MHNTVIVAPGTVCCGRLGVPNGLKSLLELDDSNLLRLFGIVNFLSVHMLVGVWV